MKFMIASDIHGSAFYCEKLLEAYKKEGAERLLVLGDILYHGPRNDLPKEYNPKAVITMLNEMKEDLFCVRGNCDTEVDQMVLEFPILADYCFIELDGHNLINLFSIKIAWVPSILISIDLIDESRGGVDINNKIINLINKEKLRQKIIFYINKKRVKTL